MPCPPSGLEDMNEASEWLNIMSSFPKLGLGDHCGSVPMLVMESMPRSLDVYYLSCLQLLSNETLSFYEYYP
jgi:hypothetical protein